MDLKLLVALKLAVAPEAALVADTMFGLPFRRFAGMSLLAVAAWCSPPGMAGWLDRI